MLRMSFEYLKGLLTRYLVDTRFNLYPALRREIDSLYEGAKQIDVESEDKEIKITCPQKGVSEVQFALTHAELLHFFLRWTRVFRQVVGSNAVPSYEP